MRTSDPRSSRLSRRALMGAGLAAAACTERAQSRSAALAPTPALRRLAPFPVGTAVSTLDLAEPALAALIARQFSQITPNWEMKMEVVLRDDGGFDFAKADQIAAFARANGQRLFGTTLVWYVQNPIAFQRLDGSGAAFANAYRNYITAVVGRYRGQAVGWDTVNEAVAEDGDGLRTSLWSRNLGAEDYMLQAFHIAHEADPNARLVINDYNLERNPKKRATFMRLVDRLLSRGAPIGAIGNQSHVDIDLPDGASRAAMRDLASFGLPIHVSELDVSFGRKRLDFRSLTEKRALQARRMAEVAEAFAELPPAQHFAFTFWGVRDKDSWLERPPNGDGTDQPLPWDDDLRPKPCFYAVAEAFRRASGAGR